MKWAHDFLQKRKQIRSERNVHSIKIISALLIAPLLACLVPLLGCGNTAAEKTAKVKDLEFTVVEEADLPKELQELIAGKKRDAMRFTYSDGKYTYIVAGYGEQRSGGYSICVDELYLTENAIYFKTTLIGPSADEKVTQAVTWPYVAVKIEVREEPVVFE